MSQIRNTCTEIKEMTKWKTEQHCTTEIGSLRNVFSINDSRGYFENQRIFYKRFTVTGGVRRQTTVYALESSRICMVVWNRLETDIMFLRAY